MYWIAEWPRSEVTASFLQPLILMPGVRRALSLTAEPLPATRALRDIRRAKVEHAADTAQRARLGQVDDEAAHAEADDVIRRERELADGHADLRFAGCSPCPPPPATSCRTPAGASSRPPPTPSATCGACAANRPRPSPPPRCP